MAEKISFNSDAWKCQKLKYVTTFSPNVRMTLNLEVTFLPMEAMHDGFYEMDSTIKARDAVSYTSFEDGDILLAKVTPCFENGNLAIAHDLLNGKGFGSSEYHVLRCDESVAYNRFILYLLMNDDFKQSAVSAMTGSAGLKRVPSEFVMNYEFYLPPLSEQHAIATYLDRKCGQIDDIIADLQRQIARLESYKKSLISETVTKGLNPDVPMKDSGIEWIGQMPEHWDVSRLKYCCEVKTGPFGTQLSAEEYVDEGIPIINVKNIGYGSIKDEDLDQIPDAVKERLFAHVLQKGDIVFGRKGAVDKHAIINSQHDGWVQGSDCMRVRIKSEIKPEFLNYYFGAVGYGEYVLVNSVGATMASVNAEILNNSVIVFPGLEEQRAIATYLDRKCAEIDTILDDKRKQVENMKNHRKSVIYEYVTGKKRVKEV